MSVFQNKKTSAEATIEKVKELSLTNPDGIGVVGVSVKDKKWEQVRKLEIKETELKKIFNDYEFVNIHLRLGTSGKKNELNIHFWQEGEWLFAHNGIISDYGTHKTLCDSRVFFNVMCHRGFLNDGGVIKYKKIRKLTNKLSYWGRFVLINIKTNRIYYFGDYHACLIDKDTMIISSQDLDFNKYQDLFGVRFEKENDNILKTELDGIFYMDLAKQKMVVVADAVSKYGNYGVYGGYKTEQKTLEWQQV